MINKQRLSLPNIALSFLVILLTFNACKKEEGYANIKIIGSITDTQGNPIDSLLVTIENQEKNTSDQFRSPFGSGKFERIYTLDSARAFTYIINVEDIDGEKHGGTFKPQNKTLKITLDDYKKNETQLIIHRIAEKEVTFVMEKSSY